MPEIYIKDLIIPKFDNTLFDVLDHDHTHYSFPGGRGGTKSSFVGTLVPLLITQHPTSHAVAFRRYANTSKDSTYAEIQAGIEKLEMSQHFKCTTSPLEIKYKPTGQKILFRGFDEPAKIKSIKVPFGYIGITWFEELDQFPGRRQLRKATQSTMRGGDKFWNFETFNPPVNANNWANEDILIARPDRLVTWSNYLDVPPEWLGQQFFDEADFLKETDEKAYRHEYLGEAVGTGGMIFENVKHRELSDDDIRQFDRIHQGVDWGWFPDPYHWSKCHYDAARRNLYIFDEYRTHKTSNEKTWEHLQDVKKVNWNDGFIIADSAEQKSVGDYQVFGARCRGAVKGPGSVEYGIKWLQSLNSIVIDARRCPHTYKEFTHYEHDRDKNGDIITGYPDRDNHSIDSVRYAMEPVWRVRGE